MRPALRARLDAHDLLQEVWLRAWKRFDSYDSARSSFRAWILGIAKNVLYEVQRKIGAEPLLAAPADPSQRLLSLESLQDSVTSISKRLARDDALARFLAEAERLDPTDHKVLVHCGLEDLTCAQAATLLGMSEDAVMKRWQRLRARLREGGWERILLPPEN
jgi:RNA polymerase sigma-70 factor (ECF subfamily)